MREYKRLLYIFLNSSFAVMSTFLAFLLTREIQDVQNYIYYPDSTGIAVLQVPQYIEILINTVLVSTVVLLGFSYFIFVTEKLSKNVGLNIILSILITGTILILEFNGDRYGHSGIIEFVIITFLCLVMFINNIYFGKRRRN